MLPIKIERPTSSISTLERAAKYDTTIDLPILYASNR